MKILGATRFDQCVINQALIHLCNQQSHIGLELRRLYQTWADASDATVYNPWREPHQFKIYVPHPDQEYEGLTLAEGLTKGYNLEVQRLDRQSAVPYKIPAGGHLVIVLKQKGLQQNYQLAATGIFVRPLAALMLDLIDPIDGTTQSIAVHHPIIRSYPSDWQQQLRQFLDGAIEAEALPQLVGYVDQATNRDYRSPAWHEVYQAKGSLAGF